jgi:hypothetical protein
MFIGADPRAVDDSAALDNTPPQPASKTPLAAALVLKNSRLVVMRRMYGGERRSARSVRRLVAVCP